MQGYITIKKQSSFEYEDRKSVFIGEAMPVSTEAEALAFIERAKAVHGDKYDYSKVEYINMHHKVLIICPVHGLFEQLPQPHLKGQGCPECGKTKQKQTMIEKYGVDNPMKSKDICQKARKTCLEKYGTEWARSNEIVQSKCESTNLTKYGVRIPIQNQAVKAKIQNTLIERYGKVNPGQVPEFKLDNYAIIWYNIVVNKNTESRCWLGK